MPRVPKITPSKLKRPTLAIDFDGVIHAYSKGWQGGEIYDVPSPGTRDALRELSKKYRLVIFTARTNLEDVVAWLQRYRLDFYFDAILNKKPAAVLYIDDRGLHFENWEQALEEVCRRAA